MKDLSYQYSSSVNLSSRIQIHELYSVNKQDWHSWLLEQINLNANCRVLELGCGNGAFWYKTKHLIPKGLDVTLSDYYNGMLVDTKKNLEEFFDFKYKQINIQEIPFETDSFDVIIANHMLYHVPDRKQALKEVRRVLKTGGVFYCSTIGNSHLVEFGELLKDFDPDLKYVSANINAQEFGLENGKKQLREFD
jgi:ubiquinone/menaquinone biosynthesis C-methylase UbiE